MLRAEAKARSRQRLIDAAVAILDEHDVAELTTVEITKRAGLAQSSFYVHFASIDHLLKELVDQVWEERRTASRRTREAADVSSTDEWYRVRFGAHVAGLIAHPAIFRLVMRARLDPNSVVGEDARAQQGKSRKNLAAGLKEMGAPARTAADKRRLRMAAAGLLAVNETIALGHLEGEFPDFDEVLEVLQLFHEAVLEATVGSRAIRPRPTATT